jgi:hypothetical protein
VTGWSLCEVTLRLPRKRVRKESSMSNSKMGVVSPEGLQLSAITGASRHLDTLEGKTIGEVYNNLSKASSFQTLSPPVQGEVFRRPDHSFRPIPIVYVGRRSGVAEEDAKESLALAPGSGESHAIIQATAGEGSALRPRGGGSRKREKAGHPQRGGDRQPVYGNSRERAGEGEGSSRGLRVAEYPGAVGRASGSARRGKRRRASSSIASSAS